MQSSMLVVALLVACATFAPAAASSKRADMRGPSRQYDYSAPAPRPRRRRVPVPSEHDLLDVREPPAVEDSYMSSAPDRASVDDATTLWIRTVTSGLPDAPQRVARLYARDAILWGTVSDEVRTTTDQILQYFEHFARVPGLRLIPESLRSSVQIYGNVALSSGYYSFSCSPKTPNGPPKIIHGRYTFVYRRLPTPREDGVEWEIVNHHSSTIPTPPADLGKTSGSAASSISVVA